MKKGSWNRRQFSRKSPREFARDHQPYFSILVGRRVHVAALSVSDIITPFSPRSTHRVVSGVSSCLDLHSLHMARPRACDACSLRKVRCTGQQPCPNCARTGLQCSFAKRARKPGPKGPRGSTWARLNQQLQNVEDGDGRTARGSLSPFSPDEIHVWSTEAFSQLPPVSPPLSPAEWEMAFTLADILAYLEIYNQRMYPVWPVINVARISAALRHDKNDPEQCALAFAVCASTGAQLRFYSYTQGSSAARAPHENDPLGLADRFAVEAERYRSKYDYRESTTTEAILVPLFLHFYYGAKGKKQTTSFLLREAVTLCQLMGLDKEETYGGLDAEEESYRRRTFWLLYVTERGHAMQHGTPICLSKTISLPSDDCQSNSQVLQAFNSLVHLFASVDGVLVHPEAGAKGQGQRYSKEMLSQLQQKLRRYDQSPMRWTEAQRSDIAITQQWLRILVWQLSLRSVSMSRETADDSMSFTYPAHISKDALHSISTVSLDALVAHGPGMVSVMSQSICFRVYFMANNIFSNLK